MFAYGTVPVRYGMSTVHYRYGRAQYGTVQYGTAPYRGRTGREGRDARPGAKLFQVACFQRCPLKSKNENTHLETAWILAPRGAGATLD